MTRQILSSLFGVYLAVAFSMVAFAFQNPAQRPPNIVFIFCDDHAYQAIGAYGSKLVDTPNIDSLAKSGMRFDRCLVTNSICGPSRATILTGKYSHKNGFLTNNKGVFDGSQVTFPKLLQNAGYQTAMVGKWHLVSDPTGFDYWHILPGQGAYYNPPMIRMGEKVKHTGYTTDIITDLSLAWLKDRDPNKPFMLMCQHKAPHREWAPNVKYLGHDQDRQYPEPPTLFDDYNGRGQAEREQDMTIAKTMTPFDLKLTEPKGMTADQLEKWNAYYRPRNEAFNKAKLEGKELVRWKFNRYMHDYLAVTKSVDESVGRITAYLKENGLEENTLVVYSSDQGFFLGEHGWFDKRWIFEESLRTPLICKWPSVVQPGSSNANIVSNLDFAETFLDVAGVKVPAEMQGRSLLPILRGNPPADWRKSFYYHYYEFPGAHSVRKHYGVITDQHKLVRFYGEDANYSELFDLKADPHEMKDVFADPAYATIRQGLETELLGLRKTLEVPEEDPIEGNRKAQTPKSPSKLFVLAGDSTVTDDAGWGIGFAELLSDQAKCVNMAKGGRSSRSYRDEGWWQKCLDLKPDYLLIQFGHNDQPGKGVARESAHDGDFRDHLRRYVAEARAAGIQPILVTSLTRRRWNSSGRIEPTLAEYAAATSIVAKELSVPLIDLHKASVEQCEQLGPTAFRALEPMTADGADHTHLNLDGSRAVGPLVATALLQVLPQLTNCFSAEKVATRQVPQSYLSPLKHGALSLEETEATITITQSGHTVLVYNKQSPAVPEGMNPLYHRSGFLHPVQSPAGQVVTATFPADHAHQHGIFSAWVKTTWNGRSIDFWNLAGGTGRVLHQRVVSTFTGENSLGFEVDLIHRAEADPVVDVLRERWKVTSLATDGSYHAFDIDSVQTAQSNLPLLLHEYHYGGMAVRGPVEWLMPEKKAEGQAGPVTCAFVNDLGSDRLQGNHQPTKWVCMTGYTNQKPVSIAVLCHPSNFRAPQPARIHPTKPYFVFAPSVQGEFSIDREHPYAAKYRYLITDSAPDSDWLNAQWKTWSESQ